MLSKSVGLSIIIVNWKTREPLLNCLESVFRHSGTLTSEVIVVDNGSRDGSVAAVKENYPQVKIITNPSNLGFARANNQAISSASGRYCLILNSDAELTSGALQAMVEFMEGNPRVGIAGAKLLNRDGSMQNSFDNIPTLATELLNKSLLRTLFPQRYPSKKSVITSPLEVESIIGACMLIRRKALDEVGLLDEDYFLFLEETDLCFRMRKAGWQVFYLPHVHVYHLQGESKAIDPGRAWIEYYRSLYKFFRKNRSYLSYLTLRVFKVVKLSLNFILTTLGLIFSLAQNKQLRRRSSIYSKLFIWHILLCPEDKGLRELEKNID
jgi:hypothetical protein